MSTPTMKGFTTLVPYEYSEILDTSDSRAFNLGVVEPGGSVTNYYAWWYNLGYAYLYNGQLSLVVGGTLDDGADADTIDVMNIGAPYTLNWLNHTIPATPDNTSGWTYPMQDPFRPFLDRFIGGIKWDPPIGATTGIIHKCFQWDGSYHPDTWDYIYYPLGNGYTPDSVYLTDPVGVTAGSAEWIIEVDATTSTGYRVKVAPEPLGGYLTVTFPATWAASVDNAIGYCISAKLKTIVGATDIVVFNIDDGTYAFDISFDATEIVSAIGVVSSDSYIIDTTAAYVELTMVVKGTLLEIYINGTLRMTQTLDTASSSAALALDTPTAVDWGYYIDYIKYYLGGNSIPIT